MAGHMGMDWNTQKGLKVRNSWLSRNLKSRCLFHVYFLLDSPWTLHVLGAFIKVFFTVWTFDPQYTSIHRHLTLYTLFYINLHDISIELYDMNMRFNNLTVLFCFF